MQVPGSLNKEITLNYTKVTNAKKIQQEIHVYAPNEELSTFGMNISSHTEYYQNMYHKDLYTKTYTWQ